MIGRRVAATAAALLIASAATAQDTDYRAATNSVLAQLGAAPAPAEADAGSAAAFGASLKELVEKARGEGQSDAYIESLVMEAAGKGTLTVPDAMRTNDGTLDRQAIIASIVSAATSETDPSVDALRTEAVGPVQTVTYTVASGDSLGRIAQQFYGDTLRYEEIFEANRDKISRADRIYIGQVLTIPNVPADS